MKLEIPLRGISAHSCQPRKDKLVTVSFSQSSQRTASSDDLVPTIRRILGDTSATGGTGARLRACLCAGFARPGVTSADVRRVILAVAQSDSGVARVARSKVWPKIVREASAVVDSNAQTDALSVTNRMLSVARSSVGRLLLPLSAEPIAAAAGRRDVAAGRAAEIGEVIVVRRPPFGISPRAEVTARAALAVIGGTILASRTWDSALFSADWLALQLNCSRRTAVRAAGNCVKLGWLRRSTSSHGIPRYRLTQVRGAEAGIADEFEDTVTALATGRFSDDALAELIISLATDHVWAYSERWAGTRGWAAAVSALACVQPATVGLTARDGRRLRKEIAAVFDEAGLSGLGVAPLGEQLPIVAELTLSDFVYRDRLAEYEAEQGRLAEERMAFTERRRAERELEKRLEEAVFKPAQKFSALPKGDWGQQELEAYVGKTRTWWNSVGEQLAGNPNAIDRLRHQLRFKFSRNGVDKRFTDRIVDALVPPPIAALPPAA
jgi:hypothetical protein